MEFKRGKKSRSKKTLFNPYKNGISSYDMIYLASKKGYKSKTINLDCDPQKEYHAA